MLVDFIFGIQTTECDRNELVVNKTDKNIDREKHLLN